MVMTKVKAKVQMEMVQTVNNKTSPKLVQVERKVEEVEEADKAAKVDKVVKVVKVAKVHKVEKVKVKVAEVVTVVKMRVTHVTIFVKTAGARRTAKKTAKVAMRTDAQNPALKSAKIDVKNVLCATWPLT